MNKRKMLLQGKLNDDSFYENDCIFLVNQRYIFILFTLEHISQEFQHVLYVGVNQMGREQ